MVFFFIKKKEIDKQKISVKTMNYLGRSIIEEVRSTTTDLIPSIDDIYSLGSSLKRWYRLYVSNNLPLDNRSLPTHLPNGLFASMCHPMRFSNGVPSGTLLFPKGVATSYILSGFGTPSAYNAGTTSLKYAGTYKYHVTAEFAFLGLPVPGIVQSTLFIYDVKIGDRIICTSTDIQNISPELTGCEIDISGTIDMLENAGTASTSVYVTMNVSYKLLGFIYNRTWTNYLEDVDTTTNSHYQLTVSGLLAPSAVYDNSALVRHIGTLECIHSNVTPTD